MINQSGTGKGHPSQDQALQKTCRKERELEEALKKIGRLEKENEKLKKELAAIRKPPKWAKANKTEEQKKGARKKGPKFGHAPAKRSRPTKIDQTIILIPEVCPNGGGSLPFPSDSK